LSHRRLLVQSRSFASPSLLRGKVKQLIVYESSISLEERRFDLTRWGHDRVDLLFGERRAVRS